MNRFFIDKSRIKDFTIEITGQDANHISKVLRLGIGDPIMVCDGEGMDYPATIIDMDKGQVILDLGKANKSLGEPRTKVTLYQGMPKGTKMELIIQKTVELGIEKIVPINTSRTIATLDDPKKARKRIERWQRIAEEAAKQSQRGIIPKVAMPKDFTHIIKSASHDAKILFWEEERDMGLKAYLESLKVPLNIGMVIGPEGGLHGEEARLAEEYGWESLSLGPRVLRTETAGIAALSAIMCLLGEMG